MNVLKVNYLALKGEACAKRSQRPLHKLNSFLQ